MLFKQGLQQPSRWNLDDFEGDDPNTKITKKCSIPEELHSLLAEAPAVYFLHPKLQALAKNIPKQLAGTIEISQETTVNHPEFTGFDGTDQLAETQTHVLKFKVPVYSVKGKVALFQLPPIDVELCSTFAKQIIPHVQNIQVYTPGQVYGPPVCAVYANVDKKLPGIPEAEPPTIVQGITAALLSSAQRFGKAVTGIIVYADGAAGYEMMLPSHVNLAKDWFLNSLNLKQTSTEPEISALYL